MPGRPKEFDRDAALAKATDCFWSRGYEAASVAQLLEVMGVGRQSAYDTFGDKRQLFQAALEAYADRVAGDLKAVLTEGPSPVGRIRRFLHVLVELGEARGGRGCLITNTIVELAPHDPAVRQLVSELLRRLEDALATNVRAAVDKGELRADIEPRAAARLLLAVMQGALVLAKTDLAAAGGVADAVRLIEHQLLRP